MADLKQDQLPPGMQPGPAIKPQEVEQLVDEMGVANPTLDISEYIKYRYYKCEEPKCGKKEFAGALDKEPFTSCVCATGPADPATKKFPHGRMKLLNYIARRDGAPMTKNDYVKAGHQK